MFFACLISVITGSDDRFVRLWQIDKWEEGRLDRQNEIEFFVEYYFNFIFLDLFETFLSIQLVNIKLSVKIQI